MTTTASLRHPLTRALVALTFTTGVVDAASYLGLGRVFTANMTGNVVLLGFGLVGGNGLPVLAPLLSLAAFVVGSGLGGALAVKLADRHPAHVAWALGSSFPFRSRAELVDAVIGSDVIPSSAACDAVAVAPFVASGLSPTRPSLIAAYAGSDATSSRGCSRFEA